MKPSMLPVTASRGEEEVRSLLSGFLEGQGLGSPFVTSCGLRAGETGLIDPLILLATLAATKGQASWQKPSLCPDFRWKNGWCSSSRTSGSTKRTLLLVWTM